MFDTSASAGSALTNVRTCTRSIAALNKGLRQSSANDASVSSSAAWDDADGYYIARLGEVMGSRYMVTDSACGKGVYSSIVKAKVLDVASEHASVAIKVVRANKLMEESVDKEIEILSKLKEMDGSGKKHVVEMLASFSYRGHQCIVFECMWDDLREALRKHTKGKGMNLAAITRYTYQLLLGLHHMHKCRVLHADIKPDNILVSEDQRVVKFCDLGTATYFDDLQVAPYLMSRFYRAPEIILGCKPTAAVDSFALACTLYELFTGKVLFPGKGNHDQLRQIMDVKGSLPASVIKSGTLWERHFDQNLVFKSDAEADPRHASPAELDGPLQLKIAQLRAQMEKFPKKQLKSMVFKRVGPERSKSTLPEDQKYLDSVNKFVELLEAMLALQASERIPPRNALGHPFVNNKT
eukprot:TRINITY_DN13015_c0_g1_i1.p1 TRINITY_DN13015_c0_g1~~TRINITY_DN13015_c0_g1_i1.p1  ORF type:complete len:449 (-),score=94.91 TRINITY_DN13015_c0_g1_i1:21-1250(-)